MRWLYFKKSGNQLILGHMLYMAGANNYLIKLEHDPQSSK